MTTAVPPNSEASGAVCPNCNGPCAEHAPKCMQCGASFGEGATWRPLVPGRNTSTRRATYSWWFIAILAAALYAVVQLVGQAGHASAKSVRTPEGSRYSTVPTRIVLRPSNIAISIPSNELWYVHTNAISRGWPENEPEAGKPWDRAEVRLLLPQFEPLTPNNEKDFRQREGKNLFIITVMRPQGFDGDTRRQWKIISLIPIDADHAKLIEQLKVDERVRPPRLARRHEELGLDEYEGKDVERSRYFTHDDFVLRCWAPPFATIKHLCEASFNLPNGLLVNFQFPQEYLARWLEIRERALRTANGYQTETVPSFWERVRKYF